MQDITAFSWFHFNLVAVFDICPPNFTIKVSEASSFLRVHITRLCASLRQQITTTIGHGIYIVTAFGFGSSAFNTHDVVHLLCAHLTLSNMLKPALPFQVTDCLLSCMRDRSWVTVGQSDLPKTVSKAHDRARDFPHPGVFELLDHVCSSSNCNCPPDVHGQWAPRQLKHRRSSCTH